MNEHNMIQHPMPRKQKYTTGTMPLPTLRVAEHARIQLDTYGRQPQLLEFGQHRRQVGF